MNRKRKKQMTTGMILLFFLAAGVWYFFTTGVFSKKPKNDTELTSILNTMVTEVSVTSVPDETPENAKEKQDALVVYVCGSVNTPGIYTLPGGSRLYEAIALAGGFSADADPSYHNLARSIADGERIYILSYAETKDLTTEQQVSGEKGISEETSNGLVNLNTATAEQLMELPGIGEARASDILAYRAKIGQFTNIEEIKNVSGIGDVMFEKIKDKITVK